MRRFASLAGVSLIAGGITALLLFATSARALPDLELGGGGIGIQQEGPGSGETTTSTTTGGSGSGETTTTTTGGGSSTSSSSSTSTTVAGGTSSSTSSSTTSSTVASNRPTISTSSQSVQAGGTVQVNGASWPANIDVSFVLNSDPVNLGSVKSGANGTFSVVLQIPSNTTSGTHTLTATGAGQTASLTLVVSSSLAVAGLSWNLAILGLALLAAGIIVLAGDRIGRQELIDFV